jgi:hypothetical protein
MKASSITTTTRRYEFTRVEILRILTRAGYLSPEAHIKSCHVNIPGGGDWSNTDLDLEDHPIVVVTEETKEE